MRHGKPELACDKAGLDDTGRPNSHPSAPTFVMHAVTAYFGSPRITHRLFRIVLLALGLASGTGRALAAEVDFSRDVRPLLNQHCTPCHGGVKKAGGVSFLFRESAMTPGKSGAVPIKPGDLENSEAIRRLLTKDEDDRMPPAKHGPRLAEAEIATLRDWVKQGAAWKGHWAYAAPALPALPPASKSKWGRTPLDRFILAKLDAEKLRPAKEADREAWLRRVSFDLTGLPPTPTEAKDFLADKKAGAHERVVDRLLKSPHFGERWAAPWLDLARYADSQGYEKDAARTVWPWRDWVIRAFNDDLPFDQFTVRLLAGDLLPDATLADVVASAFNRHTPTNAEGGTDDEEYRVSAVLDRVSTTWKTWQAVSFNCIQCHAHPYDPFDHAEFYQFLAFFNTSQDWDLNGDEPRLSVPLDVKDFPRAREVDRVMHSLRRDQLSATEALNRNAAQWRTLTPLSASSSHQTKLVITNLAGGGGEVVTEGTVSHDSKFTLELAAPEGGLTVTALRVDALPKNPEAAQLMPELGFILSEVRSQILNAENSAAVTDYEKALADARAAESKAAEAEKAAKDTDKEARKKDLEARRKEARDLERKHPGEVKWRYAFGDEVQPFQDPQTTLDPDSRGWGALSRMTHPRHLVLVPETPFALLAGSKLRVLIRQEASPNDMAPLVLNRGRFSLSADPAWTSFVGSAEFKARWDKLAELRKERDAIKAASMPVMAEQEAPLKRPTAVFQRGNWMNHGERVAAGVPKIFPQPPAGQPVDRLAMARWIASTNNPLTARVAVNRVWEQLFGAGIVDSVDDFGTSGQAPSHPELLDFLAVRFQTELGWSVKRLLRELVLSATYRQDASVTPQLRERDPANRLLARGPRTRLAAEMVRDNALAVSGLLSEKMFGPPVMPLQPDGIWRVVYSSQKWETSKDADAHRRALYTYWRRSAPYPSLLTFDAPNRSVCAARRLATSTPLQALVTLNDPVYMEAARALGERMAKEGGAKLEQQLAHGYRLATGRAAAKADLADLAALHGETLAAYRKERTLAEKLGGTPEQAALTLVANALLNLDATLTK